jgi:hypothetical protein
MSSPKAYRLEEIGGDAFSSLDGAQQAATGILVDALTETIRRMLQDGRLTVHNGRIVPASHRK